MAAAGTPELVGRQPALDRIREWVQRLGTDSSCLAISGVPGIGKTSLWQVAVDAARADGVRVLLARPVEAELPLAYAALADLFGDVVEDLADPLPAAQGDALSAALGLGESPSHPISGLVVGRACLSVLALLGATSPVLIAIDDAQWLDASSARVLAFVARRLAGTRCSMLLGWRTGSPDPLDAEGAFGERLTRIELGGLSLGAISHIVRSRIDADLSRGRIVRIHERSAGNPFHAIQLARVRDDELPDSLAAGLQQRLAEAPAAAVPLLEVLAVRGPMPISAVPEAEPLDLVIGAGLVVEDGDVVRFEHPLLAEAAYRRIPPGRRRTLHAEAAQAAHREHDRARHLALSAVAPDAATAEFLGSVARKERMRGAPEIAAELAAHARRIMPPEDVDATAQLALDEAGYLFLAGDETSAAALIEQILAGPAPGAVRAAALVHRALARTEAAQAVSDLEQAVAEPHHDAVLSARALAQLAWQRGAWLGDVEAALPEAADAVALAEASGDPAALAAALTTQALLLSTSRGVGAEERFRRAVEILQRTTAEPGDHTPLIAFAHERLWRGHFAEADELFAAEERRVIEAGDDGTRMRLAIFRAELETRRGRWTDAERLLEAALDDARGYWRLTALIRRGVIRARRGEPAALADADELASRQGGDDDAYFTAAASHIRGLIAMASGDLDSAGPLLAQLAEAVADNSAGGVAAAVYIPAAVAALAGSGDVARARAVAELLVRRMAILEPWGDAAYAYSLGIIDLAEGAHEAASERLAAAAAAFAELGSPWDRAQALLALGMAQRRAGHRSRAAEVLEQASEVFAALRAEPARLVAADELRRARPRPTSHDRLTEAERRVAGLAAEGRTNREIAAALFTGVTTVEAHLTRIYSKLAIRSRTELARRVSEGSLVLDAEGPPPRSSATRD